MWQLRLVKYKWVGFGYANPQWVKRVKQKDLNKNETGQVH